MFVTDVIHLEDTKSTNLYLKDLIKSKFVEEGTVVCAKNQTAGRGQGRNVWQSERDKNLLFSFVLYPKFLAVEKQFLLSKLTALSLFDLLSNYISDVKIKWSNDLYVKNSKIAGILIENSLMGSGIESTVIGIGLNVNQRNFDKSLPNPTSMSLETEGYYDLDILLDEFFVNLGFWYDNLLSDNILQIDNKYHDCLYKLGEQSVFEDKNGKFLATITGVDELGRLCMNDENDKNRVYFFKEIKFCNY